MNVSLFQPISNKWINSSCFHQDYIGHRSIIGFLFIFVYRKRRFKYIEMISFQFSYPFPDTTFQLLPYLHPILEQGPLFHVGAIPAYINSDWFFGQFGRWNPQELACGQKTYFSDLILTLCYALVGAMHLVAWSSIILRRINVAL